MILNVGSINADHFYTIPHLVAPGETLAATSYATGLGGKGANQSVAASMAGADVRHIGAVGPEGGWLVEALDEYGVDTRHIETVDTPTAHAIVMIDAKGENQIVIYPGANHALSRSAITRAFDDVGAGDWLMLQNETSLVVEAAQEAHERRIAVAYSAAPFEAEAVREVLPFLCLLFMNAVEARQLSNDLGTALTDLPVPHILVTKGSEGAEWIDTKARKTVSVPAKKVDVVDTTGAGDTFAGFMVAGLAQGFSHERSMERALAAAALAVTKRGTADAIPSLDSVLSFLA
jgi:ribokinase